MGICLTRWRRLRPRMVEMSSKDSHGSTKTWMVAPTICSSSTVMAESTMLERRTWRDARSGQRLDRTEAISITCLQYFYHRIGFSLILNISEASVGIADTFLPAFEYYFDE